MEIEDKCYTLNTRCLCAQNNVEIGERINVTPSTRGDYVLGTMWR